MKIIFILLFLLSSSCFAPTKAERVAERRLAMEQAKLAQQARLEGGPINQSPGSTNNNNSNSGETRDPLPSSETPTNTKKISKIYVFKYKSIIWCEEYKRPSYSFWRYMKIEITSLDIKVYNKEYVDFTDGTDDPYKCTVLSNRINIYYVDISHKAELTDKGYCLCTIDKANKKCIRDPEYEDSSCEYDFEEYEIDDEYNYNPDIIVN